MPRRKLTAAELLAAQETVRRRRQAEQHELYTGEIGDPPDDWKPRRRYLRREPAIGRPQRQILTIKEGRKMMEDAMLEYLATPNPQHKLLIKGPPGLGKTRLGTNASEILASSGKRVLYCASRHDLFLDIMEFADRPNWWYEWIPRRKDDDDPFKTTCTYQPQMEAWQHRRYPSMKFCAGVCGWSYVHDGCAFHAQKQVRHPIIFAQHQHLVGGHPLLDSIDVVIGDESPIGIFPHDWEIPAEFIVPSDMDPTEPITEILHNLHDLVLTGAAVEGPLVINALGGADAIREAVALLNLPVTADIEAPPIHNADDVARMDYAHLPILADLLDKEAAAFKLGTDYPPRIVISNRTLHLYRRNTVAPAINHLPVVWLDGTANEYLYRKATGWQIEVVEPQVQMRGRIFQVWDTANTKGSLVKDDTMTAKATRIKQQVDHIISTNGYQRPAIIAFQELGDLFPEHSFGYFYGTRGTNRYEDHDALVIIGTPQPSLESLVRRARQLFPDRWTGFRAEWTDRDQTYNYIDAEGQSWSCPSPGWWNDPDLQALLWQHREAEIIQSAHRVRPLIHAKDVWLLLNLPIDELPPTRLLTVRELFGAPDGVDPYRWQRIVAVGRQKLTERGYVTAADLVDILEVQRKAANHYIDCLTEQFPDDFPRIEVKAAGRGRPAKAAGQIPHPEATNRQN